MTIHGIVIPEEVEKMGAYWINMYLLDYIETHQDPKEDYPCNNPMMDLSVSLDSLSFS